MQKYFSTIVVGKIIEVLGRIKKKLLKLLPFISLFIPVLWLYFLHANTFEPVWTGTWENRVGYVFFLWLLSIETILNWENIQIKKFNLKSIKTVILFVMLLLPTIYVIISNYFGLNEAIFNFAHQNGIEMSWAKLMPLSTEYLVFAIITVLIVFLELGRKGLATYSLSISFLLIIGTMYSINNLYPFGKFTPFQILVPTTATLASKMLNFLGYQTALNLSSPMPLLSAWNQSGFFGAYIDWPCAGIESLLVYTVTILLFLRRSSLPLINKIIYFTIGAMVTYVINILRIVTIFTIAVNNGDWGLFHDYFGPLYSLAWIASYPLIIIGSQMLLDKGKK